VNEEVASIAYDNLNYRLLESEQPWQHPWVCRKEA
jgi:hypothetical protein